LDSHLLYYTLAREEEVSKFVEESYHFAMEIGFAFMQNDFLLSLGTLRHFSAQPQAKCLGQAH
jgi:hypothetical protein